MQKKLKIAVMALFIATTALAQTDEPKQSADQESVSAGDLTGLLMVALRSQGNWRWEGPLGTPLGLVHWKRASSPVEAGTAGYL